MTPAYRDGLVRSFVVAWHERRLQGILDALNGERGGIPITVRRRAEGDTRSSLRGNRYKAMLPSLSDLAHGSTFGKLNGGWTHSDDYYARIWSRNREIWANITSLLGHGRIGQRIVEDFYPKSLKVYYNAVTSKQPEYGDG